MGPVGLGRWEAWMLRLAGGQVESLFDELLPVEVRELPADLAALDRLLADPRLLAPVEQAWEQTARDHGRPTIPMARFVRLMVIKQRTGWGYQTLVREVSDSLHLRRFCLLPLTQRVPDESTVRKLVRRLGPETVNELGVPRDGGWSAGHREGARRDRATLAALGLEGIFASRVVGASKAARHRKPRRHLAVGSGLGRCHHLRPKG